MKLIVLIGLIALGYWYYTGPYKEMTLTPEQQAIENARLMNNCMREEAEMTAGAGLSGVMSDSGDVQAVCAKKLSLELSDGQWQSRGQ